MTGQRPSRGRSRSRRFAMTEGRTPRPLVFARSGATRRTTPVPDANIQSGSPRCCRDDTWAVKGASPARPLNNQGTRLLTRRPPGLMFFFCSLRPLVSSVPIPELSTACFSAATWFKNVDFCFIENGTYIRVLGGIPVYFCIPA